METIIDKEENEEAILLNLSWKFPPAFNHHSRTVETVSGLRAIRESLVVLMRTRVGERIMEHKYGCDLTPLAFQQLDLNLKTFMINNIKQAIAEYEPRVEVVDLLLSTSDQEEGVVDIHISYKVKELDVVETIHYGYHPIFHQ